MQSLYLVIQSHSLVDDTYIPSDFARRRFLNTLLREVIVPNTHSSYIIHTRQFQVQTVILQMSSESVTVMPQMRYLSLGARSVRTADSGGMPRTEDKHHHILISLIACTLAIHKRRRRAVIKRLYGVWRDATD